MNEKYKFIYFREIKSYKIKYYLFRETLSCHLSVKLCKKRFDSTLHLKCNQAQKFDLKTI